MQDSKGGFSTRFTPGLGQDSPFRSVLLLAIATRNHGWRFLKLSLHGVDFTCTVHPCWQFLPDPASSTTPMAPRSDCSQLLCVLSVDPNPLRQLELGIPISPVVNPSSFVNDDQISNPGGHRPREGHDLADILLVVPRLCCAFLFTLCTWHCFPQSTGHGST